MNKWQQKGYDAFIELWVQFGYKPSAHECPARYMKSGIERSDFIRGWNKAKEESK